ncbi:unnamed protein product [Menidia menidia]|uniref:(Atlantic silverside) hypothetical protein n=1 Tax=Menidia menidia TaxID=238744 RepID=A0A8S4AI06_9TELE|nr:unnamed protein product [Menidia menidia]
MHHVMRDVSSAPFSKLCKGSRCAAALKEETALHPPHPTHLLSNHSYIYLSTSDGMEAGRAEETPKNENT